MSIASVNVIDHIPEDQPVYMIKDDVLKSSNHSLPVFFEFSVKDLHDRELLEPSEQVKGCEILRIAFDDRDSAEKRLLKMLNEVRSGE